MLSVMATFWLEVLEDSDGDGMPDQLPEDYPDTGVEPYDLIEDEDDDNDGCQAMKRKQSSAPTQ